MKIGVISDTHTCWDDRYAKHFADCDEIWHAGDIGDVDTLKRLMAIGPKVRAVSGNIDNATVRRYCPELLEFEAAGAKVILTHIGGYPGRYAPGMRRLLIEKRPTIMVCGHSHILRVMYDKEIGVLHINPGAAGYYGWQKVRTLVRFDITDGKPSNLEVIELGKPKQ
jgi:putative phosphoesterase